VQNVEIEEIDQRWGATATKWVWAARPRYVLERDGTEREDLQPVDDVTPQDYSDQTGWWTCHPDTKLGNLSVIYRSEGKTDPGYGIRGPKDLRHICLATSDAFPLADDPLAGEFSEHHGCRYVVVGGFDPPIGIDDLRADSVTQAWSALRAGFVRSSMLMSEQVWRRLIEMSQTAPGAGGAATAPRLTPAERRDLERRLEGWLEAHPEALCRLGIDVTVQERQMLCNPGREGTIDLLCLRNDQQSSYVAVEIKADEVKRDAVAQVLGYVGWLRSRPEVERATGLVIGLEQHIQVPWVLGVLPRGVVRVAHWSELDLPVDLAEDLGL
jgi:hypothetical protein